MLIEKPNWVKHVGENGETFPLYSVDVHPDGNRFVTGGGDNRARIWSVAPVRDPSTQIDDILFPKLLGVLARHLAPVNVVRWSNDGRFLATGSDDTTTMIWHLSSASSMGAYENWRCCLVLQGHVSDIKDLCWSPCDSHVATCSIDNTVRVWDVTVVHVSELRNARSLAVLKGHTSWVRGVCWDPVGKYVASVGDDGILIIWRTFDWTQVTVITRPFHSPTAGSSVRRMSWSPDGVNICASHAFKHPCHVAAIVHREDWACDLNLVGHDTAVGAVRFNRRMFMLPREHNLNRASSTRSTNVTVSYPNHGDVGLDVVCCCAIASQDSTISVWIATHGRAVAVIRRLFQAEVTDLAWTSAGDGVCLIASSLDGNIACLQFENGELGKVCKPHEETKRLVHLYGSSIISTCKSINEIAVHVDSMYQDTSRKRARPVTLPLRNFNGFSELPSSQPTMTAVEANADLPCYQNARISLVSTGMKFESSTGTNSPVRNKQIISTRKRDGKIRITPVLIVPERRIPRPDTTREIGRDAAVVLRDSERMPRGVSAKRRRLEDSARGVSLEQRREVHTSATRHERLTSSTSSACRIASGLVSGSCFAVPNHNEVRVVASTSDATPRPELTDPSRAITDTVVEFRVFTSDESGRIDTSCRSCERTTKRINQTANRQACTDLSISGFVRMEEDNASASRVEASKRTVVTCSRNGHMAWRDWVSGHGSLLASNGDLTAVVTTRPELYLYSQAGRRICPPLLLQAPLVAIQLYSASLSSSNHNSTPPHILRSRFINKSLGPPYSLAGISAVGDIHLWNVMPSQASLGACICMRHLLSDTKRQLLARLHQSRATGMLSVHCEVIGFSVRPASSELAQPVISVTVLACCDDRSKRGNIISSGSETGITVCGEPESMRHQLAQSFVYNFEMKVWSRIASPCSQRVDTEMLHQLHHQEDDQPRPLCMLQKRVRDASVTSIGRGFVFLPKSAEWDQIRARLEHQMCAAIAVQSSTEYLRFLSLYARMLAMDGKQGSIARLRELCNELAGSLHSCNTTWAPSLIGLDKRNILKDILLPAIATNKSLHRMVREYTAVLEQQMS